MRYCAGPNTTKGGACACCARTRCSYKHFAGAAFESEKAARVLLWCAMRCAHMQTRPLRRIHTQNTRAHPDTVYLPACMHADQIPACTACCACCAVPVRIAGHMTCACTHAIAHAVANASCKSRVRHSTACVAACVTACATCCNTCLAALFPPLNLQSCLDLLPVCGCPSAAVLPWAGAWHVCTCGSATASESKCAVQHAPQLAVHWFAEHEGLEGLTNMFFQGKTHFCCVGSGGGAHALCAAPTPHAHPHTPTHARAHTHARTHTRAHTHARTHARTHTHTCTRTHSQTTHNTNVHMNTHANARIHPQTPHMRACRSPAAW